MGAEENEPSLERALDASVREYYEKYLKAQYPELTKAEIQREVKVDLQIDSIVRFVKSIQEMDKEIRRDYPDIGWTTLPDFVADTRSK